MLRRWGRPLPRSDAGSPPHREPAEVAGLECDRFAWRAGHRVRRRRRTLGRSSGAPAADWKRECRLRSRTSSAGGPWRRALAAPRCHRTRSTARLDGGMPPVVAHVRLLNQCLAEIDGDRMLLSHELPPTERRWCRAALGRADGPDAHDRAARADETNTMQVARGRCIACDNKNCPSPRLACRYAGGTIGQGP